MPSDLKLSVQSVTPDVTLTLSDPYIGSAYSPQVDVSEIEGGHEVTITHKSPSGIVTDTFDVLDGVDGTDGVDGVSPTVEIESTSDAHTITITDADGAHSYTVDTYADEEAARATAESSRVAAESSRVTAEQARATAESSRAAAESARVTAEASRATAEQTRAAAESSRAEAEQARATAETARATAESARATAEQGRATAEQARATAETARASAESGRVSAETARVSAENARASAESARATAESARASAETSRATAETARASAETARATEWAEIESDAQGAITAAESATEAANDAAALATRAAANLWNAGNVLIGELAEGTVLTADDAYAAPPKNVEVYGKSTQVQTTGKNLLSDVEGDWQKLAIPNVETRWVYFIPVEANASYTYSRNNTGSMGFFLAWAEDTSFTGYEPIVTLTNYQQYTVTNTTHAYLVVSCAASGNTATAAQLVVYIKRWRECQIEKASAKTAYEPWSGKAASPRPDWPQSIYSVDDLTLEIHGKNLFDDTDSTYFPKSGTASSSYYVDFTASSSSTLFHIPRVHLKTGYTYTMSMDVTSNLEPFAFTVGCGTGSYGNDLASVNSQTNGRISLTFTPDADRLRVYGDVLAFRVPRYSFPENYTFTISNIQLEYGSTATAYEPYVGQSIPIPLSNHIARSLPDGTRDELTLSYQGPSTEHEGWGVFRKVLTQRVTNTVMTEDAALVGITDIGGGFVRGYYGPISAIRPTPNVGLFTHGSYTPSGSVQSNHAYIVGGSAVVVGEGSTADDLKSLYVGSEIVYPLLNPITHDLGTVELPILPNPLTAWADGGSAQPTIAMEYERALSIVIPRIEAAISDLATS